MSSLTTFKIYRYQLIPIDRHTDDLYGGLTTEQLIQKKNEIFAKTLPFVRSYRHRGSDLSVRLEEGNDAFLMAIAPPRTLTRETPDFRVEQVDHWPQSLVIVLNRESEQYIAVQDRSASFGSTDTVTKLIQRATRASLAKAGLRLHTERVFRQSYFWELVDKHRQRITCVEFEFVTPNMANISSTLSETLKQLAKDTNSSQSKLQLRADPASALDLDTPDTTVTGLVQYTSEGGGDIVLKVKGMKKRIHTSASVREIEMDDLQLSGSVSQVSEILRGLLK